jgi:hypothetical protein
MNDDKFMLNHREGFMNFKLQKASGWMQYSNSPSFLLFLKFMANDNLHIEKITCSGALRKLKRKIPYGWDLNIYGGCIHSSKESNSIYLILCLCLFRAIPPKGYS